MSRTMCEEGTPAAGAAARGRIRAFTLIEVMIAVAIVGLLASVAGTNYFAFVEKARVARAVAEIKSLATAIDAMALDPDAGYPASLAEVEDGVVISDPWGNPYQYLRIAGTTFGKGSPLRKDRFLVPLNTDYDLYSMGADGDSAPPLSLPQSADDVVRANDGGYFGLGEYY